MFHRVAVSGTLTMSGYAELSVYFTNSSWNDTINGDKKAVITANKLELLENASIIAFTAKDVDKYAIKVTYLTLDTAGEMHVYARTSGFTQVLRVESDDIDLVNFKRIYICAKTSFKSNLTNVPELLEAADDQVHGDIYGTTTQKDGEYILEIVPSSVLCKVSFNANGGTGTMEDVNNVYYNYEIPSCLFTAPENKKFRCWAINKPDGATTYVGANYNIAGDITLYPVWMDLVPTSSGIKIGQVFGTPASGTCSYNQDSGVLTIRGDFNTDISISGSETDRSNIIIAFDGNHAYGNSDASQNNLLIQNNWGNITLVNNGEEKVTVYLAAITTNYSLIIQGNLEVVLTGIDWNYHSTWRSNHPELGFIYAKEKLSILGEASLSAIDPVIPTNVRSSSAIVAAGLIEIDTTGEVEIGTKTNKYGNSFNASVCIVGGTASNIKDKLIIRQCGEDGYLKLYRYNSSSYIYYTYIKDDGEILEHSDRYNNLTYYKESSTPSTNVALLSIKPYTVTFDSNGGTGSMDTVYLNASGVYTLPECSFTAPENCHFAGWRIGTYGPMQPGTTYQISDNIESITVYPIWIKYIESVSITSQTQSVKAGSLSAFTVETSTEHITIQEYGDVTCWVYWSEEDEKWLKFTGDLVATADGTHYGLRLACSLDDGYEFVDDNSIVYFNSNLTPAVGHSYIEKRPIYIYDYIFIDLGEAYNVYTVTYYPNGGTGSEKLISDLNEGTYALANYLELEFAPQEGKQFKGWATSNDGEIINTTTITLDSDKALYAIWEDIPPVQYTVSFDANGGSGKIASIQYAGTYTLPECGFNEPSGKEFAGWATSKDGEVITTATITIDSDVTLFAKWKDKEASPEPTDNPNPNPQPSDNPQPQPSETPQPASEPKGLSAGAVVLIVIASCVVIGVGGFAAYWFIIEKKTWADFVKLFKKNK